MNVPLWLLIPLLITSALGIMVVGIFIAGMLQIMSIHTPDPTDTD